MTANRSLDEFGAREEAGTGDAEPDAAHPGTDDPVADQSGDQPDPPTSTYVWSPDGAPCASCGDAAEARWRDGDALVCADCKEW